MYKDMLSILKDGQVGDFKLQHFDISDNNFYAIVGVKDRLKTENAYEA